MSETRSSETTNFATGAVRSSDANHLDFTSMPLIGLLGVARSTSEGATKYARFNYMKGMPVHDLLNHAFRHMVMFTLGDRSEPHLEHAAWGLLAAIQSQTLDPEVSAPHMLGPGATLTAANLDYLAEQAPILKAKREAGEFAGLGDWQLTDLPEIKMILEQRRDAAQAKAVADPDEDDEEEEIPAEGPQAYPPVKMPCVHSIYGPALRIETDHGKPTPGPDETWVEYDDGTRAYYPKGRHRTPSHIPVKRPVETPGEAWQKAVQQAITKYAQKEIEFRSANRRMWSEFSNRADRRPDSQANSSSAKRETPDNFNPC